MSYDEKSSDLEKTAANVVVDDARVADSDTTDPHMHRALKGRQVSMIAIAGTIGTGLFLGSGKAIANGGPVGAVIGYTFVGCLVGLMMFSLGEVCHRHEILLRHLLLLILRSLDDVLRPLRWRLHRVR